MYKNNCCNEQAEPALHPETLNALIDDTNRRIEEISAHIDAAFVDDGTDCGSVDIIARLGRLRAREEELERLKSILQSLLLGYEAARVISKANACYPIEHVYKAVKA